LLHARIETLVFGCADPKAGAAGLTLGIWHTRVGTIT